MAKFRYNNIDNVSTDKTLKDLRQWRAERRQKIKDYSYVVPNVPPKLSYLAENKRDMTITWIGHSTFFLQYEGMNVITDPIWARRLGFEKRLGQPGIPLSEVPPIDLILISHAHYDHLHIASIRKLYREGTTIVVPAGLRSKMIRKGFRRCIEMQWWEEITLKRIKLSFVPAQHWTRRTPFDTNTSHWGDIFWNLQGGRMKRTVMGSNHNCLRICILPEIVVTFQVSRRSEVAIRYMSRLCRLELTSQSGL